MSEKDNIQFAEKQFAAVNARDLDGYASRIDEAYVGESETAGVFHGREGARKNIEMILAGFPDLRIEIEEVIAGGDSVAVRTRSTGTHKGSFAGIAPTGKSVVVHGCSVMEIRNGKAVKGRLYSDTASLLMQIGVLSLPKASAAS